MHFYHHQNTRNKQILVLLAACIAFLSIIIASALAAPHDPPVVIVPTSTPTPAPTPPPPPVEHPLTPDSGYYGVYRYEGAGMSLVPVFYSPAPFKIVWRCEPIYGPHWLRMPVYQLRGAKAHEESDIVNFTCDPAGLKQAHAHETYPPGIYSISILSHVSQKWELLIETKTLDVPVKPC